MAIVTLIKLDMRKGILLLIICLGLGTTLRAQDSLSTTNGDSTRNITLQEAINIALKNNYLLKQADNNLDLANKSVTNEYADFLPSVSGNLNGSSRKGQQLIRQGNTQVFQNNVTNGLSGGISADFPIFNGFQNILSLRISKADKESAQELRQRTKEDVIFNTASGFLQVLLDKKLLDIARENLASSQKELEQVQAQVDVGSRPTVDLYNQQSIVASNELDVVNQNNSLKLSRLQLIRQLQVDPLKNYTFEMPDVSVKDIAPATYDLNTLVQTALENRADLKSDKANLETLELQLKQTKFNLLPTLTANAGWSSNYYDQYRLPGGESVGFHDQFFDQNLTKSIGFSLNVPIFSNLDRTYQIQTAKINLKNARLDLENSKLQVIQDVNQAYNDYQSIIQQMQSTDKALQAAQKSYETQQERYRVGAGTLIELSDSNAQYVEAQSNRARAVYNFIFQRKLLDYYVGKLGENISLK